MKTISRSFPEKSTSLDIKVSKIYLHLFIFNKYSGKILTVMRFLCFVLFSFKMEQSPTSLIISDFYNLVSNGHMSQKNGQIMQLWSSTEGLLWAGRCTDIFLYSMSIYLAMFFKWCQNISRCLFDYFYISGMVRSDADFVYLSPSLLRICIGPEKPILVKRLKKYLPPKFNLNTFSFIRGLINNEVNIFKFNRSKWGLQNPCFVLTNSP